MPWTLEIHTIDVGQGESSLIIAQNVGVPGASRTMLIDGGFPGYAKTVHTYVSNRLDALRIGLNHILVSHYDVDHSGGIIALLKADNLYRLCEIIAQAGGAAAAAATGRNEKAAAIAAAYAAIEGGYNDGKGNDRSEVAVDLGDDASKLRSASSSVAIALAKKKIDLIVSAGLGKLNDSLLKTTQSKKSVAIAIGSAAGSANGNAASRTKSALKTAFEKLKNSVEEVSQFETNGMYRNINIIDIGNTPHIPDGYTAAIDGTLLLHGNHGIQLPGIGRTRINEPALGREILWDLGNKTPPVAPMVFVVACRKRVWNQSKLVKTSQPDNDDSIGLILRFNKFFYYTGGDLPSEGEELVAVAVKSNGLPNPVGGNLTVPTHIAAFKCGHHGSYHSTSQQFLKQIKPHAAIISCGVNQFGKGDNHPDPGVVKRLHDEKTIQKFYLTNCNYITDHIPASDGQNQLDKPKNKSRLAGQNDLDNLDIGRNRGDIVLSINEGGTAFNVEYYDDDDRVSEDPMKMGMRTESIHF